MSIARGCIALLALLAGPALAATDSDSGGPPFGSLSASASLDFQISIGKFIYFRVGTGAYPAASPTIDTVSFNMTIPGAPPTTPVANANNVAVPWNSALPTFTGSGNVVGSEVRSNAGQVRLQATVVTPLVSGPNTIPFSTISIASSDPNLPAPTVPNVGTGPMVNVVGTAFGNLVTNRTANWTFSFAPVALPPPGTYNGQLLFTASAP